MKGQHTSADWKLLRTEYKKKRKWKERSHHFPSLWLKWGKRYRDSCQGFSGCLLFSVNHFTKNNINCNFRRTKPGNIFPSLGSCPSFSRPQIPPHQVRSAPLLSPKNLWILHAAETVEETSCVVCSFLGDSNPTTWTIPLQLCMQLISLYSWSVRETKKSLEHCKFAEFQSTEID